MAKGSIPKFEIPPPLKSGAKRRLRTGFNHDQTLNLTGFSRNLTILT